MLTRISDRQMDFLDFQKLCCGGIKTILRENVWHMKNADVMYDVSPKY